MNMSKNFDSPLEIGFCGAVTEGFNPAEVERYDMEQGQGYGAGGAYMDATIHGGDWVASEDYDRLLEMYRAKCAEVETLRKQIRRTPRTRISMKNPEVNAR